MKVIFLDIDGVLVTNRYLAGLESQSQPWRDKAGLASFCPKCLTNLEELVRQTGAKVVLSSSWRFFLKDLNGARTFFRARNIHFDIYDITPTINYYEGKQSRNSDRGEEIQAWLDQNIGA